MSALTAILFDKDGTLLDFNRTWLGAYQTAAEIIAEYSEGRLSSEEILVDGGYIHAEQKWQPESVLAAGSSREIVASWNRLLQTPLDQLTLGRIGKAFHVEEAGLVPTVEPLAPCLAQLVQSGYSLGIATMDSESGARRMADALGVGSYFGFLCGADSGFGEKPNPGMVNAFAEATGYANSAVVMVGDSPRDIMMGINAGAGMSVGVTSGAHSREELLRYTAHVLPDIGELHGYLVSHSD